MKSIVGDPPPAMPTHLLFDHDGVLVDTERWFFEATREALARLGIEMTFADYKQHLVDGTSNWAAAKRRGASASDLDAARGWRDARYQEYLQREDIDIPGVAEVLEELSARYSMAVITTSKRADFELIHRERDLLKHMAFVLCNEDYTTAKPHPEPYLAGLHRFGIEPESAVVIEDSKRGLAAAKAAGIRTIKVYNAFVAHQDAESDFAIQSLQELPTLLAEIDSVDG